MGIVRRFIHLLEQSQHDFWEESEVLRLQEEVVKRIRGSRQLESDLDLMDIKIGLLVKNRITLQVERGGEDSVASCPQWHRSLGLFLLQFLSSWRGLGSTGQNARALGRPQCFSVWLQEVVSHCKKLTKKNREQLSEMMSMDKQKGLKSLSKEKRQKLEAYQHLFYLLQVGLGGLCCVPHSWRGSCDTWVSLGVPPSLQTQPVYLARLIFQMPQSKSTKFMESVIFTLYNYASNPREAYLLLQLFKVALQEEIRWVHGCPGVPWTGPGKG